MKSFLMSALILSTGFISKAQAIGFDSSVNSNYPQAINLKTNESVGDTNFQNTYLKIGTGNNSKSVHQLEELINFDLSSLGVEGSAAFFDVNSGDEILFNWYTDSNERDFFSDRFYFWDGKSLVNFGGRYLAWNRRNSYRWYSQKFSTAFTAKSNKIAFLALDTQDAFGDTELRIDQIRKVGINPKFVKTINEPSLIAALASIIIFLREKQLIKRCIDR